jgi:hypothetical protein
LIKVTVGFHRFAAALFANESLDNVTSEAFACRPSAGSVSSASDAE